MDSTLGILESHSLWYEYKTRVWLQEGPELAVIHNIMRTLRSIRNCGTLAYVSVPITSGRYFYERKMALPAVSNADLVRDAIRYNYNIGWEFVRDVVRRRQCPVLYPADLVPAHQAWAQDHFQALWLNIIGEKCTEVHMAEGWEYSNGGVEEFVHVEQLRLGLPRHPNLIFFNTKESEVEERARMESIRVYDHNGKSLSLQEGVCKIHQAVEWLTAHFFETTQLRNSQRLLEWTAEMVSKGFYQ